MKQVLIVSPYFPPSSLAGVHRARHLAKHLPAAGWRPIVLCVDERLHEETIDPELSALLPEDLEVVKAKALPSQLTRRVGVGDLSLRAFHNLRSSAREILGNKSVDTVFITGSPYYPMLLSRWLKQRYGKPVVLDFRILGYRHSARPSRACRRAALRIGSRRSSSRGAALRRLYYVRIGVAERGHGRALRLARFR